MSYPPETERLAERLSTAGRTKRKPVWGRVVAMTKKKKRSKPSESGTGISDAEAPKIGNIPAQRIERVRILWETEPPPLYCNFGAVGVRLPGEFSLTFCSLSGGEAKPDEGGQLTADARIVASIKMQPAQFYALISLMLSTWNNWTGSVGELSQFRLEKPKQAPGA